ncbi:MAG TPA: hypothetical protein VIG66_08940, partial [Noviherbaspirillum sp.]
MNKKGGMQEFLHAAFCMAVLTLSLLGNSGSYHTKLFFSKDRTASPFVVTYQKSNEHQRMMKPISSHHTHFNESFLNTARGTAAPVVCPTAPSAKTLRHRGRTDQPGARSHRGGINKTMETLVKRMFNANFSVQDLPPVKELEESDKESLLNELHERDRDRRTEANKEDE